MSKALVTAACAAVLVACGSTPVAPPQTAVTTTETTRIPVDDPLASSVLATLENIGQVWSTRGAPDVALDFQGFTAHSPDAPKCDGDDLWATKACFDSARPVIDWERGQLTEALNAGGAMAPAIILAREYGYVMLFSYGELLNGTMPALRAECFAGVYAAAAKDKYPDDGDKSYKAASRGASDVAFSSRRASAFTTGKSAAERKDAFTACLKADL